MILALLSLGCADELMLADRYWGVVAGELQPSMAGCEEDCRQCIWIEGGGSIVRYGYDTADRQYVEVLSESWSSTEVDGGLQVELDDTTWWVVQEGQELVVEDDGVEARLGACGLAGRG